MKRLHAPRVKLEMESFKIIKSAQAMEIRVATSVNGAKKNYDLKMTRRNQ